AAATTAAAAPAQTTIPTATTAAAPTAATTDDLVARIDDDGVDAAVSEMRRAAPAAAFEADAARAAPSAFAGLKMQADISEMKLAKTAAAIFEDKNASAARAALAATPALIASALVKNSVNNTPSSKFIDPNKGNFGSKLAAAPTAAATMDIVAPTAAATVAAIARLTPQERTTAINKHDSRKLTDAPKDDPFKNEGVSEFFERNKDDLGRKLAADPTVPTKHERDKDGYYHIKSIKKVIEDPRSIKPNKNKPQGRHP
ncbi:MAG: hypothetical protein KAI61_07220, partial [Alphaproteobacteria bacterium]|nr:hypothetical protein [Alphaproteobacteria bacterium]